MEKFAKENKLSPKEIYLLRQEKSKPILEEFKAWMDKRISQTPPKGLLGKALHYALSNWDRLIRYIDHGYLKIDNNDAENTLRPFVIGRKNWLFSGHPNGAHASATLYSLIETAKACGLEPSTNTCAFYSKGFPMPKVKQITRIFSRNMSYPNIWEIIESKITSH